MNRLCARDIPSKQPMWVETVLHCLCYLCHHIELEFWTMLTTSIWNSSSPQSHARALTTQSRVQSRLSFLQSCRLHIFHSHYPESRTLRSFCCTDNLSLHPTSSSPCNSSIVLTNSSRWFWPPATISPPRPLVSFHRRWYQPVCWELSRLTRCRYQRLYSTGYQTQVPSHALDHSWT